jgi:hypothetical protein
VGTGVVIGPVRRTAAVRRRPVPTRGLPGPVHGWSGQVYGPPGPVRGRPAFAARGALDLECRGVGSALLVCPPGPVRRPAAEFAAALPLDPDRTVAVLDVPDYADPWVWAGIVAALRGRGPLRVALSQFGAGAAAPARWLAEQLSVEVVAPDGILVRTVDGAVFVDGPAGGSWVRFVPGRPAERVAARFPVPDWEADTPPGPVEVGPHLLMQPIPAGVWLRRLRRPGPDPAQPGHAGPDHAGPGHAGPDHAGPDHAGPDHAGPDHAGPDHAGPDHMRPDHAAPGHAGPVYPGPVYAVPPRADGPIAVVGEPGAPLAAEEVASALSTFAPGARQRIRLAPFGPRPGDGSFGQRIADALGDVVLAYPALPCPMPDGTLGLLAVEPGGRTFWRRDAVETSYHPAPAATRGPAEVPHATPTSGAAPTGDRRPAPEPPVDLAGPGESGTVEHGAGTVPADRRSSAAERDWLRRTLDAEFDGYAGDVLRLLARQPGLRAVEGEPLEAVVTDMVAVRVYLAARQDKLDQALRAGRLGTLWPYACCVVSGLRRLPSLRGVALHASSGASAGCRQPVPGEILTVRPFLSAVGAATAHLRGDVEHLVWSFTGRRVADVDVAAADGAARVVFAPGTRFKVLAAAGAPGTGDGRARVYLREVVEPEPVPGLSERDGAVLRRLERLAAGRDELPPQRRRPDIDPARHGWAFDGFAPVDTCDAAAKSSR